MPSPEAMSDPENTAGRPVNMRSLLYQEIAELQLRIKNGVEPVQVETIGLEQNTNDFFICVSDGKVHHIPTVAGVYEELPQCIRTQLYIAGEYLSKIARGYNDDCTDCAKEVAEDAPKGMPDEVAYVLAGILGILGLGE
jgi:hypothetical protein